MSNKNAIRSPKWIYLKRGLLIFGFLIFGFIIFLLNETKDDINADFANIELKFESYFNEKRMGGCVVSLFNKDSILYSGAMGYTDIQSKTKYTENTLQYIASISKTTIGVSLMKAQELGLLNIDDPINEHLPFELRNPLYPELDITILHLATHTSSLDYNEQVVESIYITDHEKMESLETFMDGYFVQGNYGDVPFTDDKPGDNWNYSNIASGLAAYIIELKSGKTYAEFTQKYIFNPLEMNNTKWFEQDVDSNYLTKYYKPKGDNSGIEEVESNGVQLYSNRDMITNVKDLTKYCQSLISRNPKLLSAKSFDILLSPQVKTSAMNSNLDNNGVFFFIDRNKFGITYQLTGMSGGDNCINTMMWFDPKIELGYIFIGNTGWSNLNRINHIFIYKALVSLGEHALMQNPKIGFLKRVKYKWHNFYSRVYALF